MGPAAGGGGAADLAAAVRRAARWLGGPAGAAAFAIPTAPRPNPRAASSTPAWFTGSCGRARCARPRGWPGAPAPGARRGRRAAGHSAAACGPPSSLGPEPASRKTRLKSARRRRAAHDRPSQHLPHPTPQNAGHPVLRGLRRRRALRVPRHVPALRPRARRAPHHPDPAIRVLRRCAARGFFNPIKKAGWAFWWSAAALRWPPLSDGWSRLVTATRPRQATRSPHPPTPDTP